MECNRPAVQVESWRLRECAMRLAFWRAGKDRAWSRGRSRTLRRAARRAGRGIRIRRPGFARAGAGAPAQQELDHRSDAGCRRALDCRGQSGHSAIQVRSAHPDRWARERLPAAERRAQRGACRARCRGRHQPGPVVAVARSCTRNHQEEQACRAAGIRSGPAGLFAA